MFDTPSDADNHGEAHRGTRCGCQLWDTGTHDKTVEAVAEHEHGEWDQGGYCNRLVLRDGYGDTCGYQKAESPTPSESEREALARLIRQTADATEHSATEHEYAEAILAAGFRRHLTPAPVGDQRYVAEHVSTGTKYVDVDWSTEHTGRITVDTGKSRYITRVENVRRLTSATSATVEDGDVVEVTRDQREAALRAWFEWERTAHPTETLGDRMEAALRAALAESEETSATVSAEQVEFGAMAARAHWPLRDDYIAWAELNETTRDTWRKVFLAGLRAAGLTVEEN